MFLLIFNSFIYILTDFRKKIHFFKSRAHFGYFAAFAYFAKIIQLLFSYLTAKISEVTRFLAK